MSSEIELSSSKKKHKNAKVITNATHGDEPFYNVEKILKVKTVKGKKLYFVKWEGYPETDNTWEPKQNLESAIGLVQIFEKERIQASLSQRIDQEKEQDNTPDTALVKKEESDENESQSQIKFEEQTPQNTECNINPSEDTSELKKSETILNVSQSEGNDLIGDVTLHVPEKVEGVAVYKEDQYFYRVSWKQVEGYPYQIKSSIISSTILLHRYPELIVSFFEQNCLKKLKPNSNNSSGSSNNN